MDGDLPWASGPLRVAARGGLRSGGPLPRAGLSHVALTALLERR